MDDEMNKKSTKKRYVIPVLAGIAVGALVFSNMEFKVAFNGNTFSSKPNFAEATNTFENYPIQTLKNFNEAFVQIAESTTPSVVTIFTETTVQRRNTMPFDFFGSPFDDFFGRSQGKPNGGKQVMRGLGSGVIVTADGYILTNNHVIDGADVVSVRTSDNRKLSAKVIGADPKTDIAVIKVEDKQLKPIVIGDSDRLRVGEWVIAIGSPLGENLARTVTQGIVSAKGRANVGLAEYEDFIQTDAAINPGNSGGALVNINGELVGINTAIASRTGGFEGIGFAVPSNMAKKVLTSLITSGKVTRSYLGVTIQDIDENIAKAMQLQPGSGVLVGTVVDGSPAAKAGLKTGDVILEFNGAKVQSGVALRNAIAVENPGTKVMLKTLRNGKTLMLEATLLEQSGKEVQQTARNSRSQQNDALGFTVEELTPDRARKLRVPQLAGKVVITSISPASGAYRVGIRAGDVVLAVNRQDVGSLKDYQTLVGGIKQGDMLFLLLQRGSEKIFFAFTV